ncbi:MAG: transposase [Pirellulales bacterium]|nr:transposase [Pirellulales bacterium]
MAEVTTESLPFPGSSRDALSEILKQGAQRMLACAIEAEVGEWIDSRARVTDEQGRRQVVRNGYLPERTIATGLGELAVRQPRVHDRRTNASREKLTSQILPPYLRKAKTIEELIPFLYLKGISTGDFNEALGALLGPDRTPQRRPAALPHQRPGQDRHDAG